VIQRRRKPGWSVRVINDGFSFQVEIAAFQTAQQTHTADFWYSARFLKLFSEPYRTNGKSLNPHVTSSLPTSSPCGIWERLGIGPSSKKKNTVIFPELSACFLIFTEMTPIITRKYRLDFYPFVAGGELLVEGNRKAARPFL
jgi:hypothetical protein